MKNPEKGTMKENRSVSQVPGSWNTHVTWRMAFPRVSMCVCHTVCVCAI